MRQLNDELAAAYEELRQFSYTVSHDLRSPLRTIEGYARILEEDYAPHLDSEGRKVIQTIVQGVGKMDRFIQDILEVSMLGQNKLSPTYVDIQSIIESIWHDLVAAEKQGRQIELRMHKPLPAVYTDNTLIKQLLANLLSNAVKYTRNREKAVVEVGGTDYDDRTEFYIQDNGIGFEKQEEDKVFAVFSRLVTEQEYEGTGIGLAIVKRVVDRHRGRIDVDSKPGMGTTFRLVFPKP